MATAGSINIWVRLKTANFRREMAGVRRDMQNSYRSMEAHARQMEAIDRRRERTQRALMIGVTAAVYAINRAMKAAVGELVAFEQQVASVSTMLSGPAMHHVDAYREGLASLAVQAGQTTETLSRGLYDILSASVDPARAMDVLATGAQAAIGGMTDTATSIDALTTVLNSYRLEADQTSRAADVMFQTVKRGKLRYGDLAQNIGMVAATGAVAGMRFEELAAALATMTRAGVKTEQAVTALRSTLSGFLKPAVEAVAVARQYGIELNSTTLRVEGLVGVLERLRQRGAPPEALAQIFPNRRALAGLAALMQDIKGYKDDIDRMRMASGEAAEQFQKMAETAAHKWAMAKESAKKLGREIAGPLVDAFHFLSQAEKATSLFAEAEAIKAEAAQVTEFYRAMAALEKTPQMDIVARIEAIRRVMDAFERGQGWGNRWLGIEQYRAMKGELVDLRRITNEWAESEASLAQSQKERAEREKQIADRVKQRQEWIDAEKRTVEDLVRTLQEHEATLGMTPMRAQLERMRLGGLFQQTELPGAMKFLFDPARKTLYDRLLESIEQLEQKEQQLRRRRALAEWATDVADSLKTPIDRFKEFRAELDEALRAGMLTRAQYEAALKKQMENLMGPMRVAPVGLAGAYEARFSQAAGRSYRWEFMQREQRERDRERNRILEDIERNTKRAPMAVADLN